jgi:K+-sensing histidine kinase KdpD
MLPFFFGSGINVIYATITNEIPAFHLPFFPLASQNTSSLFYGGSYLAVAQNLLSYWPATLERLVWLTLFLLAFAAPFFTTGMQRRFALLSVLFILAVALLASPIAQPRYRIPAEPFIWLSAALTLYNFLIPYFSRKRANEPT